MFKRMGGVMNLLVLQKTVVRKQSDPKQGTKGSYIVSWVAVIRHYANKDKAIVVRKQTQDAGFNQQGLLA